MTHILHRQIHATLPVAIGGKGIELFDRDGRAYIDASGGAAVSCLGHSHPDVTAALHAQADKLAYAHTSFFTNESAETLADKLVSGAPQGISHAYFVSGGSEAVEAALKMARQFFVETGKPERRNVIARRQSYHGNTLGALAAGGNEWRRAQFRPLLIDTHHIDPCYAYRYQEAGESEEAYGLRAAQALEDKILELGPDTVMAFVAEPVVGATAGAVPAVPGYFGRIREICDRYGMLLILDEVMCGMGRTGTLHACEQDGVAPDLMTIAKGLGGGYQPIGAVLLSRRIFDAFAEGSGFFQHGHTYAGNPLACAAGLAVLSEMDRLGLIANAADMGDLLMTELKGLAKRFPFIADVRGKGLLLGAEMVADPDTLGPIAPANKATQRLLDLAYERGLIIYGRKVKGGFDGDNFMVAPPMIVTKEQVGEIVAIIGDSLQVLAGELDLPVEG
ncbi:MAG: aspartate aminotransferase family protein [Mesorhizobium sp.]|nr:MAG: aspartate aminotransferase family protein [Mesorhizobium sp.]